MNETEKKLDQVFHPVEHLILSTWLEVDPPEYTRGAELRTSVDKLPEGVVGLERDCSGSLNLLDVSNAVARIVLSTVQHRLPQWACSNGDKILFGRDPFGKHAGKVSVLPQFLFGINWASTAPGFSWPVDYYVGFLPYYDVYVVTSSADSPDAFGYTDLAIGHFPADEDLLSGSGRVIKDNWQYQHDEYDQHRWENLWQIGLISADRAIALADSVWGKSTQEEFYAGF